MIDRPHRYIEQFAKVADILGFHYEAGSNVANTLREIRALGVKNCLTIKPQTPAEAIFEYLPQNLPSSYQRTKYALIQSMYSDPY